MTKYRIYEIAKELNLDNKKVLGFLADHKITVKNHMSTVETSVRDMIVKGLKNNQGAVKAVAQKAQDKAAQVVKPVMDKVAQVKSDVAVATCASNEKSTRRKGTISTPPPMPRSPEQTPIKTPDAMSPTTSAAMTALLPRQPTSL